MRVPGCPITTTQPGALPPDLLSRMGGTVRREGDALVAHGTEVYADNKRFDRLLRRGGTAPLREAILELFERALEPELGVDTDSPSV